MKDECWSHISYSRSSLQDILALLLVSKFAQYKSSSKNFTTWWVSELKPRCWCQPCSHLEYQLFLFEDILSCWVGLDLFIVYEFLDVFSDTKMKTNFGTSSYNWTLQVCVCQCSSAWSGARGSWHRRWHKIPKYAGLRILHKCMY